ncbi:MAG: hypothetical protein FWD72_06640 [Eggerthellaceae bacterium]|nr:hypothetical protein [Eggerthellaceae bacterium]
MARSENRKSINFDLDTHSLNRVFGEGNRRQAYSQIKLFMEKNGFEHRQYSGYVSVKRMSFAGTYLLIKKLKESCPWLAGCVKRFDVTDFLGESDALDFVVSSADDVPVRFDIT